jgi:hypothetical protein
LAKGPAGIEKKTLVILMTLDRLKGKDSKRLSAARLTR